MKIGITKLIKENIAPPESKNLAIFDDNGNKIGIVPLGPLKMPTNLGTKLYSFGLLSDIHLPGDSNVGTSLIGANGYLPAGTKLRRALEYFKSNECAFVTHAGDMTNIGFYYNRGDTEKYYIQMQEYKDICEIVDIPVYGITGNHENYNAAIKDDLDTLTEYTGIPSFEYTISHENELFIFLGMPTSYQPVSPEALEYLETTLSENKDKRCFIYVHSQLGDGDSGVPFNFYGSLFSNYGTDNTKRFRNAMIEHGKTIIFHGHTHVNPIEQLKETNVNISTKLGFYSMHVPSSSSSRTINDAKNAWVIDNDRGFGYLVDVYKNHLIFRCIDLLTMELHPIGQFCINMKSDL
jgi:predicted phosphodiesterase